MTKDDFRRALEKREHELLDEMEKNQTEARDLTDQLAAEPMERMVNMEGRDTLLMHNDADFREFQEVREAEERLANGTFGKCVDCGEEIPEGRLAAVPATKYCREDQEKHERGEEQASGSLTM